jgi:alpha-tubulin suppressor-like RCC1 family protein
MKYFIFFKGVDVPKKVEFKEMISSVSFGSVHSIILDEKGYVYSCGIFFIFILFLFLFF